MRTKPAPGYRSPNFLPFPRIVGGPVSGGSVNLIPFSPYFPVFDTLNAIRALRAGWWKYTLFTRFYLHGWCTGTNDTYPPGPKTHTHSTCTETVKLYKLKVSHTKMCTYALVSKSISKKHRSKQEGTLTPPWPQASEICIVYPYVLSQGQNPPIPPPPPPKKKKKKKKKEEEEEEEERFRHRSDADYFKFWCSGSLIGLHSSWSSKDKYLFKTNTWLSRLQPRKDKVVFTPCYYP